MKLVNCKRIQVEIYTRPARRTLILDHTKATTPPGQPNTQDDGAGVTHDLLDLCLLYLHVIRERTNRRIRSKGAAPCRLSSSSSNQEHLFHPDSVRRPLAERKVQNTQTHVFQDLLAQTVIQRRLTRLSTYQLRLDLDSFQFFFPTVAVLTWTRPTAFRQPSRRYQPSTGGTRGGNNAGTVRMTLLLSSESSTGITKKHICEHSTGYQK